MSGGNSRSPRRGQLNVVIALILGLSVELWWKCSWHVFPDSDAAMAWLLLPLEADRATEGPAALWSCVPASCAMGYKTQLHIDSTCLTLLTLRASTKALLGEMMVSSH